MRHTVSSIRHRQHMYGWHLIADEFYTDIKIILNTETMQLQYLSCASLCFLLEIKKKKVSGQCVVSFERHKARWEKKLTLNQIGGNILAVLWFNTKIDTPPCDKSLARRNKTLSLKLRLLLVWNALQWSYTSRPNIRSVTLCVNISEGMDCKRAGPAEQKIAYLKQSNSNAHSYSLPAF